MPGAVLRDQPTRGEPSEALAGARARSARGLGQHVHARARAPLQGLEELPLGGSRVGRMTLGWARKFFRFGINRLRSQRMVVDAVGLGGLWREPGGDLGADVLRSSQHDAQGIMQFAQFLPIHMDAPCHVRDPLGGTSSANGLGVNGEQRKGPAPKSRPGDLAGLALPRLTRPRRAAPRRASPGQAAPASPCHAAAYRSCDARLDITSLLRPQRTWRHRAAPIRSLRPCRRRCSSTTTR
jgi:hypothetical protein